MNIIIIGATSGIGLALAKEYVKDDFNQITVTGRNSAKLDKIKNEFHRIKTSCFNASVESEIEEFFASNKEQFDLIINCAGWGEANEKYNWQIEKKIIDINIQGFTKIAHSSLNKFKKQGFGHFVNISSIGGLISAGEANAYNSTKAFQINYTKGLTKLFKNKNIYITDIRPGFVNTKMAKGQGLFWVAEVDKAANQIIRSINKKKKIAYITKRWKIIGLFAKHFLN